MVRSHFIMASRFLRKYRTYTILNSAGLAAGFFCVLLIILWTDLHISTDRFHENRKNIYRVYKQCQFGDGPMTASPSLPGPLGPAIESEVPEIKESVRITWNNRLQFTRGENSFYEYGFYADSSFFRVFSFNLIKGDRSSVLDKPASVTISEKLALKYFGKTDVIGETLLIDNRDVCTITGVFRDVPVNSTLNFDFVLPFSNYHSRNKSFMDRWDNSDLMIFILTSNSTDQKIVSDKMTEVIHRLYSDAGKYKIRLEAQPLEKVHLYGEFKQASLKPTGLIVRVRLISLVAVFIILLACLNYINMATALSVRRSREIGIKKFLGSGSKSLIFQFVAESLVLTFTSFFIALILVRLSVPIMNRTFNENLRTTIDHPIIRLIVCLLPFITGLLAGLIPAARLSTLKTSAVISSSGNRAKGSSSLRNMLTISQYLITISFIFFSICFSGQMKFIRNKNLGLDPENVIFFKIPGSMNQHREAFSSELKKMPGVESVSLVFNNPLNINSYLVCNGIDPGKEIVVAYMVGDKDLTKTMKIELLNGDNQVTYTVNNSSAFINQELASNLGYEQPIGHQIKFMGQTVTIAGIVQNFHFNSLKVPVGNLLILRGLEGTDMILIRLKNDMIGETINAIGKKYQEFEKDGIFEYSFMDNIIEGQYRSEYTMKSLVDFFTLLSIIISSSGLFGLAMFTTEQRTKEIGTRKAFGAESSGIVLMLVYSFLKPISISFIISALVSTYLLNKWLQGFAFHASLNAGMFLSAALSTIIFSLLTVSWKCWRAANMNPVDSLKCE